MKRFLMTAVILLVLTAVALPMFAQSTASIPVNLLIPKRVGIKINTAAIDFDLTSAILPTTFPGYYFPTGGATEIDIDLFSNSAGFDLSVTANVDFSADVLVSQLFFAPTGTPISAEGGAAGAPWTAFSTSGADVIIDGPKLTGWTVDVYDQAIQFMLEETDGAVDPLSTVILTYTISNL